MFVVAVVVVMFLHCYVVKEARGRGIFKKGGHKVEVPCGPNQKVQLGSQCKNYGVFVFCFFVVCMCVSSQEL